MEKIITTPMTKTLITTNIKRSTTKFLWCLVFILVVFSVSALRAEAAGLYISPSSGTFSIGNNFTISAYVSSPDKSINAVSGIVTFPKEKLEAVSLSKSGSIVSLWVQEPGFSNSAGTFNFEGIILNPGFTGSQGKIISITFKVKGSGSAALVFSSGLVLANDGLGTNILKDLTNANFVLTSPGEEISPETTTPEEAVGVPSAPKISSPTHPDPEKWYANPNPKFTWTLAANVLAVKLLYDRNFSSQPKILYEPAVSEKQLEGIGEGTWYLHLQAKNINGWGGISHFLFQIDTEKPDYFKLKEIERSDLTEPQAKFSFEATDKTSGIDHYEIQIDDQPAQNWGIIGNYQTPILNPGKHIIIAKAVDKANNFLVDSTQFEIKPLEAPRVIDYPQQLTEGDPFIVKGITYSQVTVQMFLQLADNGKTVMQEVQSDEKGNFTIVWEKKVSSGVYKFWLQAIDQRGAKSEPTLEYSVAVFVPVILRFGKIAINYLSVIMGLVLLIVGFLALFIYFWRYFAVWKRKVGKETEEIEESVRTAFDILRDKIEKEVAKLDSKPGLSAKEKKICDELKEALRDSEKAIGREVKDVKKLTEE